MNAPAAVMIDTDDVASRVDLARNRKRGPGMSICVNVGGSLGSPGDCCADRVPANADEPHKSNAIVINALPDVSFEILVFINFVFIVVISFCLSSAVLAFLDLLVVMKSFLAIQWYLVGFGSSLRRKWVRHVEALKC